MIIAIDGTLASGKGTISRRLAAWFGLAYMDTGQLYRGVAVASLRQKLSLSDIPALVSVAQQLDLTDFEPQSLRTAEAGQVASIVAAIPEVRAALLDLQRAFSKQAGGAVLDGRDIGTVVCPQADVKIWVDARLEVRAERRWKELSAAGDPLSLADMMSHLRERDQRDSSRGTAPMQPAADAVLIDTSDLTIDAAVDKARAIVEEKMAGKI